MPDPRESNSFDGGATDRTGPASPRTWNSEEETRTFRTPAEDSTDGTAPLEDSSAETGERFAGYVLLELIGRGGMGEVFKARQLNPQRTVALKMIRGGQFASADDVQRFRAEANAAARLEHPNIVPVFEAGEQDGRHYFSMAYVEGRSLRDVSGESITPTKAVRIVVDMADAIHYAHSRGVLHRDLKPANVMLDSQGQVRVCDFGLAKLTDSQSQLSFSGQILGTPSYMSPEQAAGSEVGPLTDVYSLGAVLYALLTRMPPFKGSSIADTLRKVQEEEPTPVRSVNPKISRDLELVCLKCLRKDPAERYASALQLKLDLQRYLDGRPVLARPLSAPARMWRWCRRNRLGTAVILLSVVLAAVSLFSAIYQSHLKQVAQDNESTAIQNRKQAERKEKEADDARKEAERQSKAAHEELLQRDSSLHSFIQLLLKSNLARNESFRKALAVLMKQQQDVLFRLSNREYEDAKFRFDLVIRLRALASTMRRTGLLKEARETYEKSLELARRESQLQPSSAIFDQVVALRRELATLYGEMGEFDRALAVFERVLKSRHELLERSGGASEHHRALAVTYMNRGNLYTLMARATGRQDQLALAVADLRTGLHHWEKLRDAKPWTTGDRHTAAMLQMNLGVALDKNGQPREALTAYGAAWKLLEKLVNDHPQEVKYGDLLSLTLNNIAALYLRSNRPDKAVPALEEALKVATSVWKLDQSTIDHESHLADVHHNYGFCFVRLEKPEQALVHLREALKHRYAIFQRYSEIAEYGSTVAQTWRLMLSDIDSTRLTAADLALLENARRLIHLHLERIPMSPPNRAKHAALSRKLSMLLEKNE